MRCEILGKKGTWREVANSANTTIGKEAGFTEPSTKWKRRILLCEHSPIRQLVFKAKWYDLKSWVSVHLVRHWVGIIHWVKSQRPDRLGIGSPNRDSARQDTPVEHEIDVNVQAMINISRKRLCGMAMLDTQNAWRSLIDEIRLIEPVIASVMVPDCIYRGHCFEFNTCGFYLTDEYKRQLERYRSGTRDRDVSC